MSLDVLMGSLLAAALTAVALAVSGHASAQIHVSPLPVRPGHVVAVSGSAGSHCPGGRVEVVSAAFAGATRHLYFGKPAVSVRLGRRSAFAARVRLARSLPAGRYAIVAQCGSRTVGSVTVRVVA